MPIDPIVAQLARRRRQLGLTVANVERAMGIAPNRLLGRYERGTRQPSTPFVRAWAEALGCLLVLVPLDEEGDGDHDPEVPAKLLTLTQRRELLAKLAATDAPAGEVARRTGHSERTVYRRRAHDAHAREDHQ
jgi:transcriptional regulator with XRE-family HTH domain